MTKTIALAVYLDSSFGTDQELPRAGSCLENPYVFDDAARELKAMGDEGLVEIVAEHSRVAGDDVLIDRLRFKRLR